MNMIIAHQIEELKKLYIDLARLNNKEVKPSEIFEIKRKLSNVSSPSPIFQHSEIASESLLNTQLLNNTFRQIDADIRVLLKFLKTIYREIQQLEVVSKVYGLNFHDITERVFAMMVGLIQGPIDGVTTMVQLKAQMDNLLSNALFYNNVLVFPVERAQVINSRFTNTDINITVNGKTIKRSEIIGERSAPFNLNDDEMVIVKAIANGFETVTVNIDVVMPPGMLNKVRMTFGNELVGSKVSIYGGDRPENRKHMGTTYINESNAFISVQEPVLLGSLRIVIQSSLGKKQSTNDILYAFPIKQIVFAHEITKPELEYISTDINLGKKATKLSIFTEEEVPDGAASKYYLNYTSSTATGWVEIEPANRSTKANNVINTGSVVGNIKNITTDSSWDVDTNSMGDIVLHNIASVNDFTDNPVFQIENGALSTTTGEIDHNSVSLFRGVGDYQITSTDVTNNLVSGNIRHAVSRNSGGAGYVPIDMITSYQDVVRVTHADPNKLILTNIIHDVNTLEIRDKDNHIVSIGVLPTTTTITADGKEYSQLTLDDVLDPTEVYTAKYEVLLKDLENNLPNNRLIEINKSTIKLTTIDDRELAIDSDFNYSKAGKKIYIHRTVDLREVTELILYYEYTIKTNEPIPIYETHIFADNSFTLSVIGFTEREIALGNFHHLNGSDISSVSSVDLGPGHYKIETTQPYPTDPNNSYDVNIITNERSKAGIIIPDGIYFRAFEDSLRRVSQFQLANNIHPNDERSFAYFDGGLWLNREPQYVSQQVLDSTLTNHVIGSTLLGKKVIFPLLEFEEYKSIPETFDVQATIQLDSLPDTVRLKIIVDGSEIEANDELRIRNVGINNLTL